MLAQLERFTKAPWGGRLPLEMLGQVGLEHVLQLAHEPLARRGLGAAGEANVLFPFAILALAVAALVAPTLGVRRNVRRAKARELDRVTRAIRLERDALLDAGSSVDRSGAGCLSDLIQYEAFVRSTREWPFDLSIVSRSLLFVILGFGSWLRGALVEHLLELLLD